MVLDQDLVPLALSSATGVCFVRIASFGSFCREALLSYGTVEGAGMVLTETAAK